jgi:hypothetical protein
MKPDGMLVEPEHIVSAQQDVTAKGSGPTLADLAGAEPALASFIHENLAAVAGKLTLSGAPTELVQAAHEEVLSVVLTSLRALRRGHYELWKYSMTGTRLAQLDETFMPPKSPRRKKGRGGKPKG